jgi:hypothetical protein
MKKGSSIAAIAALRPSALRTGRALPTEIFLVPHGHSAAAMQCNNLIVIRTRDLPPWGTASQLTALRRASNVAMDT